MGNIRETYPAGVPCWVDTSQADPDAAAAFYGGLLGWEFADVAPEGAPGRYLVGRKDGKDVAAISSPPEGGERPPAMWNTYVRVESADDAAEKAKAAGGAVAVEPFDIPGAGRMAVLADPERAVFSVWQANGFEGAQLVNEPGAWVFSDLNTRDAGAGERFYWELFGWEKCVGVGGFEFMRLRGYAEFLERDDPDLRERHQAAGASAEFSDAVAGIGALPDGDTPPAHWSVTFGVDDADAIAARAAELGGTLVADPFDMGPVRSAVIADPGGAAFTVSRFYPERLAAHQEQATA
jgi:uncharacterized protein